MLVRLQRSMKDKDKGFTLIELLVVIVIIGILAAIAIPLFLNQRKKGVDSSIRSDIKNAATVAATITSDNPTSTVAYTEDILEDAGWKNDATTTFAVSGTPAGGDLCVSGFNAGATANAVGKQYMYLEASGGLQTGDPTTGC